MMLRSWVLRLPVLRGIGSRIAIARYAVESQGVTLSAEGKVGSGSTFTMRLPARPRAL